METIKPTTKSYIKTLQILHLAMLMGTVFLAIISIVLTQIGYEAMLEVPASLLTSIVIVAAVIIVALSLFLFKSKLQRIQQKQTMNEKLSLYQNALMVKFALVEGITFLSIVVYIISGYHLIIIIAAILIAIQAFNRPTKEKLFMDLAFSASDKASFNKPDTEIKINSKK